MDIKNENNYNFQTQHNIKNSKKLVMKLGKIKNESSLKKNYNKSLLWKYANNEFYKNVNLKQNFEILRLENDSQKIKLFGLLEIIKQKGQNKLLNTVTKFDHEKLLKLTI